jgi:hypothetical protein
MSRSRLRPLELPIPIAITGTYLLAAGHQLELKLEAPTATAQNDIMVAYDTTAYPFGAAAPLGIARMPRSR